jgi:hypothetical protein
MAHFIVRWRPAPRPHNRLISLMVRCRFFLGDVPFLEVMPSRSLALGLPAGMFENKVSSPLGSVLDDALNKDYRDVVLQCAAEQSHPSDQLIDCVIHR